MRSLKSLLVASALIATPAIASAEVYVGLDGGANYRHDTSLIGSDSDWGWVALGQVGYAFGAPKVEFELGYRANDEIDAWSTMVNGIYEFQTGAVRPFIGAGIGWAWLDADREVASPRSDDTFAYQGIAGVAFDVTNNLALKAQYRYFATLETDIGENGGTGQDAEYKNHSILVGLTYKFGAPAPVATPVAAPAPAPAPKAAPALKKNYIVFFDFDKATVTPEAESTIAQAAQAAKEGRSASVALTGHTDRSGSDKYNQVLSLKRANAVKAALVAQGVPADQISVVAKGESAPLVTTPDGAREPQNRRVEIVLP